MSAIGGLTRAKDSASQVNKYRKEALTQFPVLKSSKNLAGTTN